MLKDKYDVIIGLEIHIQTNTESKMFCSCPTNYFHKEPNTHVCPVCLGLPGALPIPNKRALELCILMGLATNCDIDNEIHFDRKHYFYPDLPKGYQISQYKRPICSDGYLDISKDTKIEIERIHQEEDVAKSTHHTESETGKEYSLIDYNKSGVPLIEIVTKPCIRSSKDAKDFATKIRQIARYLNISNADMEKGQMRCEPNISIQEKGKWEYRNGKILPVGNYKLNPKVEVKNIGSITAVEKSIEYEIERLIEEIENGKEIKQQTRGWNADRSITEFQRFKETADDYRYMPEPDIPIIDITQKEIERISEELVELPNDKIERYVTEYGLSEYDASVLSDNKNISQYFESVTKHLAQTVNNEKEAAKLASNWITGPLFSITKEKNTKINEDNIPVEFISHLISEFYEGNLTKNKGEEILRKILISDQKRESIQILLREEIQKTIEEREKSNSNINEIIDEIIKQNSKAVSDYKNGKEASIGFLVGQVMQHTKGTANPNEVRNILIEKLKNEDRC